MLESETLGVGVLVIWLPLCPVVSLPESLGDGVGLTLPESVGVGDPVGVGEPVVGVGVGDVALTDGVGEGDVALTDGVGDCAGEVLGAVGVGEVDGVGSAQVGVGDGGAVGIRLGSSGSAFPAEVDAPVPAALDVESVPVRSSFGGTVQVADGLGLTVGAAPSLEVVAPGGVAGLM